MYRIELNILYIFLMYSKFSPILHISYTFPTHFLQFSIAGNFNFVPVKHVPDVKLDSTVMFLNRTLYIVTGTVNIPYSRIIRRISHINT